MKAKCLWVGALVLASAFALPSFLASPLHAQTSLTIYNDGRVLVRRTLPVSLPQVVSTRQLTLGAVDAATIF